MTQNRPPGLPVPPSKPEGVDEPDWRGRVRPFWSEIDLLWAVVWFMGAMVLAAFVSAIAAAIGGADLTDPDLATPVYVAVLGTLTLQVLQGSFPFLISRLKGLGVGPDWRLWSPILKDIGYGLVLGFVCLAGAWLATIFTATVVGLENLEDASNTAVLTDNSDSLWIIGVIFMVTIGAPLSEEILFRGFLLRVLEKSFGATAAVIVSSLLFTLLHWQQGATWQETVVLLSALGAVGLTLAIGTIQINRLGPAIVGHFVFNTSGTLLTLLDI